MRDILQWKLDEKSDLPGCTSQESVDESGIKRPVLQLLNKGRFVERDTGREGLGHDAFALGQQLGGEPGGTRLATGIVMIRLIISRVVRVVRVRPGSSQAPKRGQRLGFGVRGTRRLGKQG